MKIGLNKQNFSRQSHFINKEIYKKDDMSISVTFGGDLFDKKHNEFFDSEKNHKLWGELYGLARIGKIELF